MPESSRDRVRGIASAAQARGMGLRRGGEDGAARAFDIIVARGVASPQFCGARGITPSLNLKDCDMASEQRPGDGGPRMPQISSEDLAARVKLLEAEILRLKDVETRGYFGFHHPIDAQLATFPPNFAAPVILEGEPLPVPPPAIRAGYAPDDTQQYLEWGKYDHDFIIGIAERHLDLRRPLRILDFGCSSGRVLRHFCREQQDAGWQVFGVDPQAILIEWMRQYFPAEFYVCATNYVVPVLPFEDNFFDLIYGISVFTHIKYLWDCWLLELRRCLKPGGLCLQTVHCEPAWAVFAGGDAEWQLNGVPDYVREHPEMDVDYLLFNKSTTSNTFFRRAIVEKYFGRYLPVVEILDPPEFSFQNWVIMKKQAEADGEAPAPCEQP
jgi:SAM-dependent methyltransferase